jgi:hypothetical protein
VVQQLNKIARSAGGPKIAGFFVRVRIRVLLLSNCKEKEERAERK